MPDTKGMRPEVFACTVGFDAMRIAMGGEPRNHDVETICRWLRHVSAVNAEPSLTATVCVYPDRTETSLFFADGVKFDAGERLVERAVGALQSEHDERGRCPAGRRKRETTP